MLARTKGVLIALLALLLPALVVGLTVSALAAGSPSPSKSPSGSPAAAGSPGASQAGGVTGNPTNGAQLYQSNCSQCHGANLDGGVGPKLNPIAHIDGVSNPLDPSYLTKTITNGKSGEAGRMLPKGGNSSLSAKDIQDLVAFIIQQNKTGAAGMSPAELARSNVAWITISILLLLLLTYLLARYNMRWIARRSRA